MSRFKGIVAAVVLLQCMVLTSAASGQVPSQLAYQGYLSDSDGLPIDDAVSMTFALYTVEAGGTPVWSETQVVEPAQGLFSVTLGDAGPLFPQGLFETPLWLGITLASDVEMRPRKALSTSAYAHRASDAETLSGQGPAAFDQSVQVATLQGDMSGAQASISALQSTQTAAQAVIDALQSDVSAVQSGMSGVESDMSQLQSDLNATDAALTSVENTLPLLQDRVTGTCPVGQAIRVVNASGSVLCDATPWYAGAGNVFVETGNRVGIGAPDPNATLQIDAPAGEDSLRARVAGSTKLMVHDNGSVSVGSVAAGTTDGLHVLGSTGLGTGTPSAKLTVDYTNWQMTLRNSTTGGSEWFVGSSSDGWSSGGGKFVVSPTNSSSNSAFVIDAAKQVGVGVLNPLSPLHVDGGSDTTLSGGGYLTLSGTGGKNISIDDNEIMARNDGATAPLYLNNDGGEVVIANNGDVNSPALEVNGTVEINFSDYGGFSFVPSLDFETRPRLVPDQYEIGYIGTSQLPFRAVYARTHYAALLTSFLAYSDRALKDDIRPLTGALDTLGQLNAVTFSMKPHPNDDPAREWTPREQYERENQIGFLAQDVEKVLPQLVAEDEHTGLKSVAYVALVPILVEAVKTQQRHIEALESRLDELERPGMR